MRLVALLVVVALMAAAVVVPVNGAAVPTQLKSASAASTSGCGPINVSCKTSADCCSGCCTNGKCSDCAHSPCAFYHCPEKKTCYLEKVTCIQAPCNPVPACKPLNSDYDTDYDVK